jgi:hypothetical protein
LKVQGLRWRVEGQPSLAGSPGPLPDGSATVENAAALFHSMFCWTDVDELRAAARAVRGFRGELRPGFQAVVAFAIGFAEFLGGGYEEAGVELQRALELATPLGAWTIVTDALGISAQVALMQTRTQDAEALALRSVDQAHTHGLLDLPRVGYYLATLGAAIARSGRLEEGDDLLATGIGQLAGWTPILAGHARLMRAPVRRQLGDMDGARDLLGEAKALLAQCDSTGINGGLVPQVARALSASHRRGEDWTDLTDRELSVLRLLEHGSRSVRSPASSSCPSTPSTPTPNRSTPGWTSRAGKRRSTGMRTRTALCRAKRLS